MQKTVLHFSLKLSLDLIYCHMLSDHEFGSPEEWSKFWGFLLVDMITLFRHIHRLLFLMWARKEEGRRKLVGRRLHSVAMKLYQDDKFIEGVKPTKLTTAPCFSNTAKFWLAVQASPNHILMWPELTPFASSINRGFLRKFLALIKWNLQI